MVPKDIWYRYRKTYDTARHVVQKDIWYSKTYGAGGHMVQKDI